MGSLIEVLQFFGGIPTFFVLFIIFIFIFRHHMSKQDRGTKEANESFWEKEEASLVVRKREIPESYFINLDFSIIPTLSEEDYTAMGKASLYPVQQSLHTLSESKMMDLSYLLNSDIRMQFGTANLPLIEMYEDHYLNCIKNIYKLASGLYELDLVDESVALLKEGIRIGTDLTHHYALLMHIYEEQNSLYLLQDVIEELKATESDRYDKIIELLETKKLH